MRILSSLMIAGTLLLSIEAFAVPSVQCKATIPQTGQVKDTTVPTVDQYGELSDRLEDYVYSATVFGDKFVQVEVYKGATGLMKTGILSTTKVSFSLDNDWFALKCRILK